MGKIILEFDSNEEAEEARTAVHASDWKDSMWELDQALRNVTKYGASLLMPNAEANATEIEVCEVIRDRIREILSENGLHLE
jgi:hypothetical protein